MDFQQRQAIYLQIADLICEKILRKEWQAKDKVPSIRELAIEIEVNPNTIVKSYSYLETKNIIFKQRGIGYFVAEDGYKNTVELKKTAFFAQELPLFLKAMELLGITFDDLTAIGGGNENK
jgi:GntR family transcriptional regulator